MNLINCAQGSPEWLQARCGLITASMFKEVRARVGGLDEKQAKYVELVKSGINESLAANDAGYKAPPTAKVVISAIKGEPVGDFTNTAKQYAFRLAVERISGELLSEDKYETWEMRRGHELEPEARLEHESQYGLLVERAGFVVSECGYYGVSVDGLIDDDGISEYKCFVSPKSMMPIILNDDVSDILDQAMGGIWLTGRAWAHIGLYCPSLKSIGNQLKITEVVRDDVYIGEMKSDLDKFNSLISENIEKIKSSKRFHKLMSAA